MPFPFLALDPVETSFTWRSLPGPRQLTSTPRITLCCNHHPVLFNPWCLLFSKSGLCVCLQIRAVSLTFATHAQLLGEHPMHRRGSAVTCQVSTWAHKGTRHSAGSEQLCPHKERSKGRLCYLHAKRTSHPHQGDGRVSPSLPSPSQSPAHRGAEAQGCSFQSRILFLKILRFLAILLLFDVSNNNQYLSLGQF